MFVYLPLRVQWVLEDLGFDTVDVRNSICSLLQHPMEPTSVDQRTVLEASEISAEKNYDVYDCFYIALARQADADRLVTTGRDFEALCDGEPFEYVNLVLDDVLSEFARSRREQPGSRSPRRGTYQVVSLVAVIAAIIEIRTG